MKTTVWYILDADGLNAELVLGLPVLVEDSGARRRVLERDLGAPHDYQLVKPFDHSPSDDELEEAVALLRLETFVSSDDETDDTAKAKKATPKVKK